MGVERTLIDKKQMRRLSIALYPKGLPGQGKRKDDLPPGVGMR
jgi:hypothetical protein